MQPAEYVKVHFDDFKIHYTTEGSVIKAKRQTSIGKTLTDA